MEVAYGWVVALVAVAAGLLYWLWEANSADLHGAPPGAYGWPVVGETLAYLGASRANTASQFFTTRVAKYGKVFKTHLLFKWVVSLPPPEGNKFLFSQENKLVQNAWPSSVVKLLGNGALTCLIGEKHKQVRKLFSTFFNPEGLQSFVPRMDALARGNLADHWEGKESIQALYVVKEFTFAIAANTFLSMTKDHPEFATMGQAVEVYLGGIMQLPLDVPGTVYHKAGLARKTIKRILDPIIDEHQQDLRDGKNTRDLLSMLLTSPLENENYMSMEDIKDNIVLMVFAGHDTSSITLALTLKYLYLNPHCLKEVIQEQQEIAKGKGAGEALTWEDTRKMKYTWRCVQETIRLQPPVLGAFRSALQDFQYEGFTIKKGWMLMWSTARSHSLPEFFSNPTKFDPSRFEGSGPQPYTYVPFGGGPHMCLGNEFARTEILVYLHHLVLNYEWEMVDPNEFVSIDPMPSFAKKLQLKVWRKESSTA